MAFDKSGNLVVIDGGTIDVFTPGTSKPARTFGSLQQPQFLVFDKAQTVLYVTNYGANQIDEFDYSTGELINTISLTGPIGLAINP
jgi:DNA-binding beta-propeller fold protein YncE